MYWFGIILMVGGLVALLFMPIATNMAALGVVMMGAAFYVGSLIDSNSDHRENSDRHRHDQIMKVIEGKDL